MQLLLRKITVDADGEAEYIDLSIDSDSITIGSSPQCDIQILGADVGPVHARFEKSSNKITLRAEKRRHFLVGTESVRSANLSAGDQVCIGDQQFTCVAAPGGFDLALEWQYQTTEDYLLENAYRTRINQLNFSPRKASWILALAILLIAGVLPVADYYFRQQLTTEGHESNVVTEMMAGIGRPLADSLWQSGPILPAHQIAMGDRCEACHTQAFVQVEDQACTACHDNTGEHVNKLHPSSDSFSNLRCQSCHKEHNEPAQIVTSSDRLCSACHNDMQPSVSRFSERQHPQFNLSMLEPQVENVNGSLLTKWELNKVSIDQVFDQSPNDFVEVNEGTVEQKIVENNHLKYPHDVHLDPKAVTHQQRGDGLQCADCHQLNADNEHFAPINMEQHCSACHDLSFDLNNPQRQLPHGESTEVFSALSAHFVDLSFNPIEKSFERRRLPGRVTIDESCQQDYDCAIEMAMREAEKQFLQSGCITCHQVEVAETAEGGERWQVLPVKINQDWYANAFFDHRSHQTPAEYSQQAGDISKLVDEMIDSQNLDQSLVANSTLISNNQYANAEIKSGQPADMAKLTAVMNNFSSGDQRCLTCHQAATSSSSSDILMPGKAQCTNCHGDSSDLTHFSSAFSSASVTLNCIACHGYHRENDVLSKDFGKGSQ